MRTVLSISSIIIIVFIVILIGKNWNKIMTFFSSSSNLPNTLNEGDACTTSDNNSGTIVNGVCQSAETPSPPRPIYNTNTLEVTNPNGAYMYYQQTLSGGGLTYSKSNVIVPMGTKFNLVKTWPSPMIQNQQFYETDYKPYGAQSGFFDAIDISVQ